MRNSGKIFIAACALTCLLPANSPAQIADEEREFNLIQGGHSGTWFNPEQPGQGLFVEVLDDPASATGKEVVVAWFAFCDNGPVWLLGQGDVVREDDAYSAMLEVSIYDGNDFPPRFDPGSVTRTPWGQMMLSFTGCDKAQMSWSSTVEGYGAGELSLRRLSQVAGSLCIPDLAGDEKADDHGDDWATGTYLTDIGRTQRKLTANLEHEGDVDVFLFVVPISVDFTAFTFGADDARTRATLYRIVGYDEELIASDDDDDPFSGFRFEEYLFPGTYSIHVTGKSGAETGPYNLYYQADWD
jgi:hypothetical protein